MRRDDLYLADIAAATDAIAAFISGMNQTQFADNDLVRSAVLQKLTVIGEASSRLSESIRAAHPQIPWPDIVAFRNIAVHRYFGIDWRLVWNAATVDVPALRDEVTKIIADRGAGDTP